MNVTIEARQACPLCACGKLIRHQRGAKHTKCYECRRLRAAQQRIHSKREKSYQCILPQRSPYRGMRPCAQRLSASCLKTFMSPDKRAIHCCPPCRHAQLLASADWAGE